MTELFEKPDFGVKTKNDPNQKIQEGSIFSMMRGCQNFKNFKNRFVNDRVTFT